MPVMICPACTGPTHVVESRSADDGAAVRRRRECTSCHLRFTTFERIGTTRIQVLKRNGRRQPFDSEKLRGALSRAAHKRDVSAVEIAAIVNGVEAKAVTQGGVISAEEIGDLCLERLAAIDRGAYFQFAGTLPELTPEIASFTAASSVRSEEDSP